MHVTVVRHGTADNQAYRDRDRALTAVGREEARSQGRALCHRIAMPDLIVSSPYARAVQTAELLAAAMGYSGVIQLERALRPDCSPAGAVAALLSIVRCAEPSVGPPVAGIVLVAHEPILSALCGLLLGRSVSGLGRAEALSLFWRPPALGTAELAFRASAPLSK